MSFSDSKKPYNTSYNRLKLALVILRNKPVDWTIEEYIRFVNWTSPKDLEKQQISDNSDNTDSKKNGCETKGGGHVIVDNKVGNEVDNEVGNKISNEVSNKISNKVSNEISNEVEISNEISNEVSNEISNEVSNKVNNEMNNGKDPDNDECWKEKALELTHEVEALKQRLCIVELELEVAKQGTSNKRRKTKAQQATTITEGDQGSNKKQSGKSATSKKVSKKFQDPESKIFQRIPGADDEIWKLFDINQAMSFLQQIKLLAHMTPPPAISVTDSSSFSPYSINSGTIITQTIIKIINYMNLKLSSLLKVFETFFDSPLISESEKIEMIITLANSFSSLIKAIHIISMRILYDTLQDNYSTNNLPIVKNQDPRDAIAKLLIHICYHVGPQLRDAVSLAAVKECLRLVSEEFGIINENQSTSLQSYSAINIPILSTDQATASLMQDSTLLTKKVADVRDVVRKDSAYFLLWILEELLTKENGILNLTRKEMLTDETRKNLSTLLERSLACNKRASLHGDAYTMYLWNVCERLWTLTGNFP
ncbi:13757_t:CDS:2 [Gigaspora rosea]|nr:13757_t:CDS:2 [Gigaspora rosea]